MGETDSWSYALRRVRRSRQSDIGQRDLGAILKLFKAAVSNYVSRLQPFYGCLALVGVTHLDRPHHRLVVLDEEDKVGAAVVLNGGGRDERLLLERLHQQARVHEL